jgi:hypothetical protein
MRIFAPMRSCAAFALTMMPMPMPGRRKPRLTTRAGTCIVVTSWSLQQLTMFPKYSSQVGDFLRIFASVPDPDPTDPHVFGPPGSICQRYGSGSFYHQAKIVKKPRFLLFCTFFWTFPKVLQPGRGFFSIFATVFVLGNAFMYLRRTGILRSFHIAVDV